MPNSMPMISRNFTRNGGYSYGFNGQEKSDEISGAGNHNTAEFWEYDTRLGRRWNLDPVKQIFISDYAAFKNSPLLYSDPKGNVPDIILYDQNQGQKPVRYISDAAGPNYITHSYGHWNSSGDGFVQEFSLTPQQQAFQEEMAVRVANIGKPSLSLQRYYGQIDQIGSGIANVLSTLPSLPVGGGAGSGFAGLFSFSAKSLITKQGIAIGLGNAASDFASQYFANGGNNAGNLDKWNYISTIAEFGTGGFKNSIIGSFSSSIISSALDARVGDSKFMSSSLIFGKKEFSTFKRESIIGGSANVLGGFFGEKSRRPTINLYKIFGGELLGNTAGNLIGTAVDQGNPYKK